MAPPAPNPADLPPDTNRGGVYLGVLVGFMVPSVLIVALRTWVRVRFNKLWWDDWLILIAIPCLIANAATSIQSIHYGIGRHIFYLKATDAMMAAKYNVIAEPLNVLAFFFVKTSILFYLLRLKPGKTCQYILWFTLVILVSITITVVVVILAQCQPIEKQWNPTVQGTCWAPENFSNAAYALSGATILTDVVYLVIPIAYLWNTQLRKRTKYAVFGVLSTGVVSLGCTIATIPFLHLLSQTQDVTYAIINSACLKTAELNIAVLVACIPPLQPLLKRAANAVTSVQKSEVESWESRQARLEGSSSHYELLSAGTNHSIIGSTEKDIPSLSGSAMSGAPLRPPPSFNPPGQYGVAKTTPIQGNYGHSRV